MLEDYIEEYEKAMLSGDKKKMAKIEKELATLGMDKYTLAVLIKERKKTKK